MQELITFHNVEFDGSEQRTVNARDLHAALQIKSNFRDWIRNRISDFGFIENQDFVTVAKNLANGGRSKEYFISINMAKELCMVERNELGRMWRAHFIKCEKDLMETKRQQSLAVPDYSNLSKIQILEMAIESEKQRIALENQNKGLQKQIEEDAPMVAFAQKVSDYGDAVLLDIAAKSVSMKPKEYWDAIRRLGWLRRDNHPMQFAIDRGYMKVRVFEVKHKSGMISYSYTPLICSKGQVKVAELCHFTFQKQQDLFEERRA